MRFSDRVRGARSQAILDAVSRVAQQRGWSALTIHGVASEAGVAKGTVYLHYADKEALLIALVERAVRQATAVVNEEAARWAHPISQLRATYHRLVAELELNGSPLTLLYSGVCQTPAGREASAGALAPFLDLLAQLISNGQGRGALPTDLDARAAAASFVAIVTFPAWIPRDTFPGPASESLWSVYERALSGPEPQPLSDEANLTRGD